jgi:hypothetical protein
MTNLPHVTGAEFTPGDQARVRPPAEWAGREVEPPAAFSCTCGDPPQPLTVYWTAGHAALAGWVVTLTGQVGPGLPTAGAVSFHPAWLAPARVGTDTGCVCPLLDLMTRGCTCGAMAAERAAAGVRDA